LIGYWIARLFGGFIDGWLVCMCFGLIDGLVEWVIARWLDRVCVGLIACGCV